MIRIDRVRTVGKHDSRRERRRWVTAVTGAAPRLGRRHQALTRGRRRSEGAAPVGDPRRPGRAAGGPFLREGALMAHLHCSGSGVGE